MLASEEREGFVDLYDYNSTIGEWFEPADDMAENQVAQVNLIDMIKAVGDKCQGHSIVNHPSIFI